MTKPEQTPDMSGPTEEEVEAVARAITLASLIDVHGGQPEQWAPCVDEQWSDSVPEARAAIRAYEKVRRK